MLDNEPNTTEAAEPAATAPTQPPAKKAAAKKTVRKRTTKKAAAQTAPADADTAISTQADAEAADPAPAPAKKAAAKRPAKKAAAKRPAKKAAARNSGQDSLLDASEDATAVESATGSTSLADAGPVQSSADSAAQGGSDASAAPAKKTTRRRTSKKAAAAPQADLLTSDNPVSDGPVASADVAEEELTEEELAAAAEAAAQANVQAESTQAEPAEGGSRRRRRAPAAAAVLFQAPVDVPAQAAATSPVEATPAEAPSGRRTRRRSGAAETAANEQAAVTDAPEVVAETTGVAADEQPSSTRRRRSRRSRDAEEVAADRAEPVIEEAHNTEADEDTDEDHAAEADENDGEEGGEGTRRRRRRRGGRRRRKSGDADGSDDSAEEQDEDSEESDDQQDDTDEHGQSDEPEDETEGSGSSSRRRRRRRRRKGEDPGSAPDDPDETVVRVREPRSKTISNEITAVEGSTRLEAKKQRRREGRAAGRRRAPIVTEAEFLARRESVERTMVIRARGDLTQIAVSEDNVLVEHYVAQEEQVSLIGNVYLGRVQNVLPSMEAAFIDIGKGRNAVLYAGEVDWNTLGGGNGPRKIESVLKSGQAVLVQVTKDPIGHKGARLTNQISLPGRYVVYVPRGGNGGISRKLPDTERNRLKGILKDIVPDEAGVIVRTAAEGATEDELTADVRRLQTYWEDIEKKSKSGQAPQLLHGEPDLLIRVVRDLFTEDFTKLVISGDDAFDQVKEYVSDVAPHLADRVEKWSGDGDVFSNYRIDEQIKKALDRKVWLPSGGSLIIDRTEAMTVVDVNTGKFTGSGGNLEETVTKNNLEAAEEIVRQLRLRDIGGIIVIDFIDMVLELNRDLVLRRLVECLGRDRTKHQVAEVTSLGLVQMTRKRIGTGLLEAFSENCDHCGGRGLILHDEPKESRRRQDDGRNRGQQQSHADQTSDGEVAKKSSRSRNRGKGRGRGDGPDELPETEQHSHDAAQRLAQIAAASSVTNAEAQSDQAQGDRAQSDRSHGDQDQADRSPSDQSQGERPQDDHSQGDQASAAQAQEGSEGAAGDGAEAGAEKAQQNGSGRGGSTRRRRGGRSRAKADDSGDSDAGNNGSDAGVSAPELESTPV
ncbi:ribonuclease E/G [Kribbella sp. VKM Ac-2568]|uniref:ribonuclease E/G n=1 Tax=Kribbella sp. VKM Ac-2568 TaxID=2512219 RepID=UPI001044E13F|nr:ribonuclease E/G [Kribbella sp. VKM Ac-2568]TCM43609.1 ribonuclease E [Kribbella sp. VKM Ac-2568]